MEMWLKPLNKIVMESWRYNMLPEWIPQVHCWLCHLKANGFWWFLLTGMEEKKKRNYQINNCIPYIRGCVTSLKQWNNIWYSSYNWSHRLDKLTIFHYYPLRCFCFLHRPNGTIRWWGGKNNHPCSFQVLNDDMNIAFSPGTWYFFWVYNFPQ